VLLHESVALLFVPPQGAFSGKHRATKDRKLNDNLRYPLLMLTFFLIVGPHNAGVEGSSPSLSSPIQSLSDTC
jgi:hypothetical protein